MAHPVQLLPLAMSGQLRANVQLDKMPSSSDSLIQRNRSVRILAKSIFRELKAQGYNDKQVVSLATELLAEVTDEIGRAPKPARRA